MSTSRWASAPRERRSRAFSSASWRRVGGYFVAQLGLAFFAFAEQRREAFLVPFGLCCFCFGAGQFGLARLQLTRQRARFFATGAELRFQGVAIRRARSRGADQDQRHERAQERPGAGQGEEIRSDPSRRQEASRLAPRPYFPC